MATEQSDIARRALPEPPWRPMPQTKGDDALSAHPPFPIYRPDIDGLRAISVIAVILYHAGIPGFSGGYVGVDVFFVISGYLITQQLMHPTSGGIRERLTTFYLRRARRILPALFVMLATVTVAAWIWLLPPDLIPHGKYVALNALMLGNFAGYTDFNYFLSAAPIRALLHLWSIGVEEQFYLLYPLFVMLVLGRWPSRLPRVLTLLAAASLAVCIWASYYKPAANFYLMPTRGWELGAGALLALGVRRGPRSSIAREWAAGLALVVLAICVASYTARMHYPGLLTVPVCLAALLLIASGAESQTHVSRLLATRPLVWVGLASYSLYLWHAPVLVFFKYCVMRDPHGAELALVGAVIALLATASWVFIERPVRTRRVLRSNRSFVYAVCASATLLFATGMVLWRSGGFANRLPPEIARYTLPENGYAAQVMRCLPLRDAAVRAGNLCRFGPQDATRRKIVVWGDSHALALFRAYEQRATRDGFSLYFGAHSACRPFVGQDSVEMRLSKVCVSFNDAMTHALDRIDPDVVVLNAFWIYDGSRPKLASDPAAKGRGDAFQAALERTVRQIGRPGRRICVVHDSPLLPWRVPYALSMARSRGIDRDSLRMPRAVAEAQQADVDGAITHLAAQGLITAVDLRAQLCDAQTCALERDGWPLYADDNHLSREGSLVAGPALDRCFGGGR